MCSVIQFEDRDAAQGVLREKIFGPPFPLHDVDLLVLGLNAFLVQKNAHTPGVRRHAVIVDFHSLLFSRVPAG